MPRHKWFKPRKYLHFDWPATLTEQLQSRISTPSEVAKWSFFPFLSIDIKTRKYSKESGNKKKTRTIMYAAHSDSALYAYYANTISDKYEETLKNNGLEDNILAYRRINGKCNIHFAGDAFQAIQNKGECCAIAFDIAKFFDSIDHKVLKRELSTVLGTTPLPNDHYNVYKSLTKYASVDKNQLFSTLKISPNKPLRRRICTISEFRDIVRPLGIVKKNPDSYGIPQGSPLSGLYANISLLAFDKEIAQLAIKHNAHYFRYSDDILIVCEEQDFSIFYSAVNKSLLKIKLSTNDKTNVHHFTIKSGTLLADSPLQYLGFMFNGDSISIRSSSISKYISKSKRRLELAVKSKDRNNRVRAHAKLPPRPLNRRTLLIKNSHFGSKNFIRYGIKASIILESSSVRIQIARAGRRFFSMLDESP